MPGDWSYVPAMCKSLVVMFGEAAPLAVNALPAKDGGPAEIVVYDGMPTGEQVADNYIAVGYSGAFSGQAYQGSTGLAVEGRIQEASIGNRTMADAPAVQCECSTFSGDSDAGALDRQRGYTLALFNQLAFAIANDPTLMGVIHKGPAYAAITTYRWLFDANPDGVSVTIQFAVGIVGEAWLPT